MGNNSIKYVGRVMVLVFCTSSDNLYSFMKFNENTFYLKKLQSKDHFQTENYIGVKFL